MKVEANKKCFTIYDYDNKIISRVEANHGCPIPDEGHKAGEILIEIDVLGTKYKLIIMYEQDAYMKENGYAAYTDFDEKTIKFIKQETCEQTKVVLRHEILHAFMYESGIAHGMQFHTEECVDWLAMQVPKLNNVFEVAECL